jgi:hypothetical protein
LVRSAACRRLNPDHVQINCTFGRKDTGREFG